MIERKLTRDEKAYKTMEAVAHMLMATSKNGTHYTVEDCYLDMGQDWTWTTICRVGEWACQVLSPRQWGDIVKAETPLDLARCVDDIKSGEYFHE